MAIIHHLVIVRGKEVVLVIHLAAIAVLGKKVVLAAILLHLAIV